MKTFEGWIQDRFREEDNLDTTEFCQGCADCLKAGAQIGVARLLAVAEKWCEENISEFPGHPKRQGDESCGFDLLEHLQRYINGKHEA